MDTTTDTVILETSGQHKRGASSQVTFGNYLGNQAVPLTLRDRTTITVRHSIEYQGPYELNIDRIRDGARTYLKRNGSEAAFRGPAGVDGVRFGLLQKADGAGFVIARLQFG